MKFVITISILLFLHLSVYAELINGPANIRKKPQGEIILSLNDSVYVDCTPEKEGWVSLVCFFAMTKNDFEERKSLKKGDTLFNLENQPVGNLLKDINFDDLGVHKLYLNEKPVYCFSIYGVTYKTNVYKASIVENLINEYLNNKGKIVYDDIQKQLSDFRFSSCRYVSEYYPQLEEFAVINDFYPDGRIRLIFENRTLTAIVFHYHINPGQYPIYQLGDFYRMVILKCPSSIPVEDFVANNIKSYSGKN